MENFSRKRSPIRERNTMSLSVRKSEGLCGASERKRGNEGRAVGEGISRDLASASPPSDPTADPFQVPIINSIRQMHASARIGYENSVLCRGQRSHKRKATRACAVTRDETFCENNRTGNTRIFAAF